MGEQSQDDSPVPGGQAADLVLVQGGQLLAVGEPVLIVVSMTPPASCESGDSLPNPNPRRALGGARRGRKSLDRGASVFAAELDRGLSASAPARASTAVRGTTRE